jgi:hypothetical protein
MIKSPFVKYTFNEHHRKEKGQRPLADTIRYLIGFGNTRLVALSRVEYPKTISAGELLLYIASI